ncbi:hypothetical protein B0H14DRAFT_3461803 [Mycena olivaceomarginata]|nr:hypothetical protein B0H14DRAFT_3461803 [Mycena olivaceomarginata]
MSITRDSVISTPELLELTLSHLLRMRDLFVTTPLRVLFFHPDPLSAPVAEPAETLTMGLAVK